MFYRGFHFIVFECLETPVKHEARVFETASQSAPDCKQEKKKKTKEQKKEKITFSGVLLVPKHGRVGWR